MSAQAPAAAAQLTPAQEQIGAALRAHLVRLDVPRARQDEAVRRYIRSMQAFNAERPQPAPRAPLPGYRGPRCLAELRSVARGPEGPAA